MPEPQNMHEFSNPYNIGGTTKLIGSEMHVPESVKAIQNVGPDEGHKMRIGAEVRLQQDDDERERMELMRILMAGGGRGALSATGKFGEKLKNFEESEADERREALEKLRIAYTNMHMENLRSVRDVITKSVRTNEKNAYPYDYRQAEFMLENVTQASRTLKNEEWMKSNEAGDVFVKVLEQDAAWLGSFLQTVVAQSSSKPYSFDIGLQLQQLKESRMRAFVTDETMELMMKKDVSGFEFSPEQASSRKTDPVGLLIPDKYYLNEEGEETLFRKDEVKGLRELAVEMQADSFKNRMIVAAVSQADFTKTNPETTTFMENNLTNTELDFYKSLFWQHDKTENEGYVLSAHIVSEGSLERKSTTLLEALLVTGARRRIREISKKNLSEDQRLNEIGKLVKEVKAVALAKESDWFVRQDEDVVAMMATIITEQGLLQDFSYMHAKEYCYAYVWATDSNGNPISKKKRETGSISSPSGDIPSLGYAQKKLAYDGAGNTSSSLLLPSNRKQREEVGMLSPFEMPHYHPDLTGHPDTFLKEQWNFLFSSDPVYERKRKALGYESLPKWVADQLKEWAYVWEVPWSSKLVDPNSPEYTLEVPHLLPSEMGNIANFFDSITTENGKLSSGATSVWKKLATTDTELYNIDWKKLDRQPHTRWMIDLDMSARYFKPLFEPVSLKDDPITGVFMEPGTGGPKELAKRIRLSKRDSDETKPSIYELAFIPFYAVMVCAHKYDIFGAYAWDKTTQEDKDTGTTNVDRFVREMSYWKRALEWMPGDRPGKDKISDVNYGKSLALIATFYESVILRVAKASSDDARVLAKSNHNAAVDRINNFDFLKVGDNKRQINKNIPLQK